MKNYAKALVLGLGSSGEAAARLLAGEGTQVTIIDKADDAGVRKSAKVLRKEGVEVLTGAVSLPEGHFDICVTSPGIPAVSPWFAELAARGIKVISELELGFTRCRCPVLAISGSNGKSTLVKLCGDALRLAGKRVELGGNYGSPLSELAGLSAKLDWLVIEVSSFQLERVETFRPRVGILLNVNPNHLDRHGNMRTYRHLKMKLFSAMRRGDVAVVPSDKWPGLRVHMEGRGKVVTFGRGCAHSRYADGSVALGRGGRNVYAFAGTEFGNNVMGVTAAAAVAAMRACGVDPQFVAEAAERFESLEHRMNKVAVLNGVTFINNSKATNLAAMRAGIEMCGGPVLLIAGGILKESNLEILKKTLAKHVRRAYFIGHSESKMNAAWSGVVSCRSCGDLETAVRAARADAGAGETVLLAPGGTSFDCYESFEERGRHFESVVKLLKEKR